MRSISKPQGLFGGKNFMTPDVINYYKLRKGYAELSEGTGLNYQPIFGVTVQMHGGGMNNPASQLFHPKREAMAYIDMLS